MLRPRDLRPCRPARPAAVPGVHAGGVLPGAVHGVAVRAVRRARRPGRPGVERADVVRVGVAGAREPRGRAAPRRRRLRPPLPPGRLPPRPGARPAPAGPRVDVVVGAGPRARAGRAAGPGRAGPHGRRRGGRRRRPRPGRGGESAAGSYAAAAVALRRPFLPEPPAPLRHRHRHLRGGRQRAGAASVHEARLACAGPTLIPAPGSGWRRAAGADRSAGRWPADRPRPAGAARSGCRRPAAP